jgi:parallel beta-helix repeat protein
MKNLILVIAIASLLAGGACAQLNGSYTVDASLPTGGGNYATLPAAASDLLVQGVSGPVTFQVVPNAAPYAGFVIATPITGSSSTNTITFLGTPGVFLSGVAPGFTQVVRLGPNTISTTVFAGPSYIVIDGFDITVPATGAGVIVTGSTGCVVRNCYVHGSNSGAGIAIVNSNNTLVENNEVANTAATPGAPGNATYCGGISFYYAGSGTVITRNRVHDCTNQGIFVGSSGSATAPANFTLTNNFVWGCTGTGTYPGGIAVRRLTGTSLVANNSVWMTTGSLAGIHQMGVAADPQPTTVANNVVKHDGTGPCFRFENTTTLASATFDYNLYNPGPSAFVGGVATTNYATLAAWQAVAAPNLAGKELNTLVADPLYLAVNDLHITPSSPAFNSGVALAAVALDIDGQARPLSGLYDRGADETQGAGLFAGFTATPLSGPAPLNVTFTDLSFSSAPGGVASWAWDFQNDGIDDAFVQNPVFNYPCPGLYSVKLTVTDGVNPPNAVVHANSINVSVQQFGMATTGGGVGDLFIVPVPASCYPSAVEGWTLISFSALNPVGLGPFGGLYPDANTVAGIQSPVFAGSPLHFTPAPGLYPNTPFGVPPGTLSSFFGLSLDAAEVLIGPGFSILLISNVARVTF